MRNVDRGRLQARLTKHSICARHSCTFIATPQQQFSLCTDKLRDLPEVTQWYSWDSKSRSMLLDYMLKLARGRAVWPGDECSKEHVGPQASQSGPLRMVPGALTPTAPVR